MPLFILLLFSGSLIAPLLGRAFGKGTGLVLSLLPLAFFLSCLKKLADLEDGAALYSYSLGVIPEHRLVFLLDGLSLLFLLLVTGIGFLILVYSHGYMHKGEDLGRYYALMMFFMGAMAGLVFAGDLVALYIFWELTSISSFMLIGFHHREEEARSAAVQAMLVTVFGGLAMLAGFIALGVLAGGFDLPSLAANSERIAGEPMYLPVLFLILLGAWTKSAHFPFHFWLPSAMVAPTPVSAYLHSAAMVNAGVFLLARLHPVLGGTPAWHAAVTTAGALTMVVGAYLSLTQRDLKKILAYTTVSALGLLTLLLGLGTAAAVKGALLYLIVHALYKAGLFMVAGTIDEEAGSRDVYLLGNLKRRMPLTTLVALLLLLSMAGLPPMLGYVGKEMIYKATLMAPEMETILLVCSVFANCVMLFISLVIAYNVFLRSKNPQEKKPREADVSRVLAPAVLAIASLLFVLFSGTLESLIVAAAHAVGAKEVEVHIELWHGMTPAFQLSLMTVASGLLLFVFRKKLLTAIASINGTLVAITLSAVFSRLVDLVISLAGKLTGFIQHGYHRLYLGLIFLIGSLGLWYALTILPEGRPAPPAPFSLPIAGIAVLAIVASLFAPFTRESPAAILIMGMVGYGLAVVFLAYGAIDLAITQFLVNTFVTVIFVIAVYRLPKFGRFSSFASRLASMVIALAAGAAMTGLAYVASGTKGGSAVAVFYLEGSLPEGHGRNVVNVILTDFRALDTLGEITVLAVSALSVIALLKLRKRERQDEM